MPASPSFPSGTRPNLNPFLSLLNICIFVCVLNLTLEFYFIFFFFSETRTRWKKRKREPQINRRAPKHEDEDDDEEEPAHDDDGVELQDDPEEPQSGGVSLQESEVLSDGGARVCDFPLVVKHTVNRPHSSVMAIVAAERVNQSGESGKRAQQLNAALLALENVSYGQLQALSAVPADAPVFDQDRTDGAGSGSSFVITPPQIMEGRGVVKRFGSRVLVVPMHSGTHAYTFTYT
jgi:SWI/SNF related-matrix-associated actin-dependent regulator of chromatin subfamily C